METSTNVLLINKGNIPHYRMPIYDYLSDYLLKYDLRLTVVAEGIQEGSSGSIFPYMQTRLGFLNLVRLCRAVKPGACIFWVDPQFYMLPLMIFSKLHKIRVIHWGHRRDQQRPYAIYKNIVYFVEHWIDDAILLYSDQLRKYIGHRFQSKTFVANNTLRFADDSPCPISSREIKIRYGIKTSKNIICMGRMLKRKRILDLVRAFNYLEMSDVGLILAGPDNEGILNSVSGDNIFKIGPVYGKDSLDLLCAADLYCLPGSLGLSIVDAFYCGLPVVTEDVRHGPEIMYLKDGINGYIVPKGDVLQLSKKLSLLLHDDVLRKQFSLEARKEIMTFGHIDRMCEGFRDALQYVLK